MTTSTSTSLRHKGKQIGKSLAAFVFWMLVWQLASALVGRFVPIGAELILPGPLPVARTLADLAQTAAFWRTAGGTLLRIFCGFAAGVVLGTLLAALTVRSRIADTLLSPLIRTVRATPVASFIILALLWIGKVRVPAFISMLMVIPVLWSGVAAAIRNVDPGLTEMARTYGFGRGRTLRLVYVPAVFPHWNAACVTALGLAWKSGVAAEVLCAPRLAIGTELYYSKIYLETPALFAWTAVVIVLSFILEKGFEALMGRWVRTR